MMITPNAVYAALHAVALARDTYLAVRELGCAADPFSPQPFARLAGETLVALLPQVARQDARRLWAQMIEHDGAVAEVYARWLGADGVRHAAA